MSGGVEAQGYFLNLTALRLWLFEDIGEFFRDPEFLCPAEEVAVIEPVPIPFDYPDGVVEISVAPNFEFHEYQIFGGGKPQVTLGEVGPVTGETSGQLYRPKRNDLRGCVYSKWVRSLR